MVSHVKSKRIPARQKYKVAKKVRTHHKNLRRQEKKGKKKEKDPGIPNTYPHKHELLEEIEKRKQEELERKREERLKRKEERKLTTVEALSKDVRKREREYDESNNEVESKGITDRGIKNEGSRKAYMQEFRRVVNAADVILQVLDVRDPIGCRCHEAERIIMEAGGGSKRIVLILNKVDLVPKEVTQKWLTYLRNEYPTVAFRSSVQTQRKVSQAKMSAVHANDKNISTALGAESLLQLLKNYTRNKSLKTACTVGIIGYPNVGKSSLINSLKRTRVTTVGATPGVTKTLQEVHLDKHIRLLDSPGIVFSSAQNNALVLRNCIKIESLEDPITPVETIIRRCGREALMVAYAIPQFENVTECLALVAKKRGKTKKGGAFDLESAARIILQDWNGGKIAFYTIPPIRSVKSRNATLVSEWGKEFSFDEVVGSEQKEIDQIMEASETPVMYAEAEAEEASEMADDNPFAEAKDEGNDEVDDEDDAQMDGAEDESGEEEEDGPVYHVKQATKKTGDAGTKGWDTKRTKLNPQINKDKKREQKKLRKEQKRQAMNIDVEMAASTDAYDFSVLNEN